MKIAIPNNCIQSRRMWRIIVVLLDMGSTNRSIHRSAVVTLLVVKVG
jgi:hypothetical protein